MEDMIETIRRRSAAYTPEWSFDEEQPDIGTAMALLFADMMGGTLERMERIPEFYRMKFYDMLGVELLPPEGARGYVTFSTVSEEVSGTFLPAGEKVSGKDEGGGPVTFQTEEDLFVSPARLSDMRYTDGDADVISGPLAFPLRLPPDCSRQSHVLYISHDTILAIKTEGEITLDFVCPSGSWGREVRRLLREGVTWSYRSEEGFVDFSEPQWEGDQVTLIKKRGMPGFARAEVQGKMGFWLRVKADALPPQSRVTFQGISVGGRGSGLLPESVYDGTMELDSDCFLPFGERPYPFAEVYLSSEEVFGKRGALIELSFVLDFTRVPGEIQSPEIPVNWRNVMYQSEFEKPEPPDIVISDVVWEYYNGSGWRRLPDSGQYAGIFGGGSESGAVSVRFICPEDIHPFLLAGRESCCIRIRVARMENMYAADGICVVPRMRRLMLDYRFEGGGAPPTALIGVNGASAVRLNCRGEFSPFLNALPEGGTLYLSFSAPLSEQGIRLLFVLEAGGGASDGGSCRFEYCGREGWKPLKVQDETMHFTRTGIVTICGEHTLVRRSLFGVDGYWLRIVRFERTGAAVTGIYINATTASAQSESEEAGNLPAGSISAMERSLGFISDVDNPERMSGGCGPESREQAVRRIASFLRHRGRAVTARDFEDIVRSGVRQVSQVRCFPGRNGSGERAPGHITLVALTGQDGRRESLAHMEHSILQCLKPHMDWRLCEEGRLHIVEPEWVTLSLYMTVFVRDSVRLGQTREMMIRRVNHFLNPVTGNFDGKGWKIGVLPTVLQIENLCSQMEEVLCVRNISFKDVGKIGCYTLGIGGEHEIELIPQ